jgi:tRNA (cytidine/uridine-2'-O-)-methyltransferase
LHVVLFEPEIPHNTGAIARLCAATGTRLHLVGRLGFRLDDAKMKRAGLDYWEHVELERHVDLGCLEETLPRTIWFPFTTKGRRLYSECAYPAEAVLLFGSETRGLPSSVIESERSLRIPILKSKVRSLNLATAVAVVLFEALRQQGFDGEGEGGCHG